MVPGGEAPRLTYLTTAHQFGVVGYRDPVGVISPDSLLLGSGTLLLLILWSHYVKRIPAYIVALFAGTGAAVVLQLDVATIGSRFGGIPSGLPSF